LDDPAQAAPPWGGGVDEPYQPEEAGIRQTCSIHCLPRPDRRDRAAGQPRYLARLHPPHPGRLLHAGWLPATLALLISGSALAQSQLDPVIDEIRALALENFNPDELGSGYAAMLNFAVSPDISAATYALDTEEGSGIHNPRLKVYRIPLRHVFRPESQNLRPFVQATMAYQTLDTSFDLFELDSVDSRWSTWGVALAGGLEIPVSEHLVLLPVLSLGLGRLDNDADYSGAVANALIKPALEGLIFDWDTKARLVGASMGLDYTRPSPGFDLEIKANLSHNYMDTFDSSSEFIDFSNKVTTFDLDLSTVHPLQQTLGGQPLALVMLLGDTRFLGAERHALDFDHFSEAGLALEADVSSRGWSIKTLRLGAKAIFGKDVSGWSLILSYGL